MRPWLLALAGLAGGVRAQDPPAPDGARVRGTITTGSELVFEARDALVFRDRFVQLLAITDRPFDPAQLLADGQVDHADLLRHHASGAQVVRVSLAGFLRVPTILTWWRPGATTVLVEATVLESALRIDQGDRYRLRGTLSLAMGPSGGAAAPQLSLAFDVLDAGSYLSDARWLPPDGGAPGQALHTLLFRASDTADLSWTTLLHPELRQRFAAANGLTETDPEALTRLLRRWLPQLAAGGLRGQLHAELAVLELTSADGRHWTAQVRPDRPGNASVWQLSDLRRVAALPAHDRLPSRAGDLAQIRQSARETQQRRSAELWLALSPLLLLAAWLLWRFWRLQRLTRHLEAHGQVLEAEVLDLERAAWVQNGCVMVRLVLGWTDAHTGQRLQVRSRAMALPKLPRGGSKDAQYREWRSRAQAPGRTIPLRVDPDEPTRRFDFAGRTEVAQLLGPVGD